MREREILDKETRTVEDWGEKKSNSLFPELNQPSQSV